MMAAVGLNQLAKTLSTFSTTTVFVPTTTGLPKTLRQQPQTKRLVADSVASLQKLLRRQSRTEVRIIPAVNLHHLPPNGPRLAVV